MVLRQHWTNKNSIDMPSDHSGSRKCNSTVRGRDSVNMPKLNMAALEQLNQNTQRTGSELENSDYIAEGSPSPIGRGIKDESSPLLAGTQIDSFYQTLNSRPRSRGAKNAEKRRNSSTFSNYYLNNKQAKEIASLISLEDRKRNDFILEQDGMDLDDLQQILNEQKSKTGDKRTQATRAMFSYKSELESLIGNLQETTQQ